MLCSEHPLAVEPGMPRVSAVRSASLRRALLLSVALSIAGAARVRWAINGLPPLAGDDECDARTMSSDGLVAAGVSCCVDTPSRHARWSPTSVVTALQMSGGKDDGVALGRMNIGGMNLESVCRETDLINKTARRRTCGEMVE